MEKSAKAYYRKALALEAGRVKRWKKDEEGALVDLGWLPPLDLSDSWMPLCPRQVLRF